MNVECEYLAQLQKLAKGKREESLKSNAQGIEDIVTKREDSLQSLAFENTFA